MAEVPGRLPLIEPMLATPVREVPADDGGWAAEAKWDGARVLAYVSGGAAVLRGRSGRDVTASYPEAAAALARAAGRRTLVLDGEIAVLTGTTRASPSCSAGCTSARGPALVAAVPVTYIAFDLLWQASRSLLRSPYAQRRACSTDSRSAGLRLSVPPAFPGQAAPSRRQPRTRPRGRRPKRLSSYQPGQRSGDWLKIRNLAAADVLIGGWLPRAGARSQLAGSVLAGRRGRTGWSTSARSAPGSPRPSAGTSPPGSWPSSSPSRRSPPRCRPTRPPGALDASCAGGRGRLRRDHARGADAAPRLARPAARVNTLTVFACLPRRPAGL